MAPYKGQASVPGGQGFMGCGVDEGTPLIKPGDRQGDQSVLHIEGLRDGLVPDEDHGLIGVEAPLPHQATLLLGGGCGQESAATTDNPLLDASRGRSVLIVGGRGADHEAELIEAASRGAEALSRICEVTVVAAAAGKTQAVPAQTSKLRAMPISARGRPALW